MRTALCFFGLIFTTTSISQTVSSFSNEKDKLSYAIGMDIGGALKIQKIEVNPALLAQAIQDSYDGKSTLLSTDQKQETIREWQEAISKEEQKMRDEMAKTNAIQGENYLKEHKKKEGVIELPSKVQYIIKEKGKGSLPGKDSEVTVHYRGTLIDGTEFDSSFARNAPLTISLNRVISAWAEVLPKVPLGTKLTLVAPPESAYGASGAGPVIGPNQTLIFDIELLEKVPSTQTETEK